MRHSTLYIASVIGRVYCAWHVEGVGEFYILWQQPTIAARGGLIGFGVCCCTLGC